MSAKEKWQEDVEEIIDRILDIKEKIKNLQDELDSNKGALVYLLDEQGVNEYTGTNGKANFVDFQREGLVKDAVVETVDDVNKGKLNHIDMKDLTNNIKVHFINVRGYI